MTIEFNAGALLNPPALINPRLRDKPVKLTLVLALLS
jgi:hypothetical protein